jgi:two-component system response regulator GlrR
LIGEDGWGLTCRTLQSPVKSRCYAPKTGLSQKLLAEVAKILLIAKCDVCVLITGETGTGKEMCARSIHDLSARSKGPFVAVNCGAVPQELLENELFGHVAGAFTGAKRFRRGLIAEAAGGTIFLDEVDCLSPRAQMKFLRFLDEKQFRLLGSTKVRRVDVRVIAASNVDLQKALAEDTFRMDLFYRINVVPLALPPLRERVEDIRPLACHFLADYSLRFGKEPMKFSEAAMDILKTYPWPGNVRELKNTVARAVVFCSTDTIRAADITLPLRDVPGTGHQESFKVAKARIVEQFERDYIQRVLLANGGNITKAAKAANKNRRALWELIRKHHIDVQKYQIETN